MCASARRFSAPGTMRKNDPDPVRPAGADMGRRRKQSSAVPIFLALYVMFFIIFMVRGEMLEFGRSMVYYAMIPVLLMRWYDRMIREKKQGYSGGKMNKILGKISSRIPGRNRP